MSDEGREELTRGEDFAAFERRMLSLFDRMAQRIEAEVEESRRRDEVMAEESRRRDEELERRAEESRRRDEELERRAEATRREVDFIIRQQAQFNADMERLRQTQETNEQKWERTEGGIRALLAIAEIRQQEFAELRQAQAEAQARTDARLAETGERVDALVNTVERLIGERRNGGRKREENSG